MPKNTDNNAPKILDSDSIIKHHGQSITKIHNAQQLLGTYASTNFCGPRTDQRNRKPNGSLNRILVPITSDLSPRLVKTQALSSLTGPSRFELIGSSEIRTTATPGSKPQIRTIKIEIKKKSTAHQEIQVQAQPPTIRVHRSDRGKIQRRQRPLARPLTLRAEASTPPPPGGNHDTEKERELRNRMWLTGSSGGGLRSPPAPLRRLDRGLQKRTQKSVPLSLSLSLSSEGGCCSEASGAWWKWTRRKRDRWGTRGLNGGARRGDNDTVVPRYLRALPLVKWWSGAEFWMRWGGRGETRDGRTRRLCVCGRRSVGWPIHRHNQKNSREELVRC